MNPSANSPRLAARKIARHSKLKLGWWFLGGLFPLLSAQGQDALTSAVSLDAILATRENQTVVQPPDRPHLGPVNFSLGAYTGVSYDDNVYESESNPQADVITRAGINLNFDWAATERSDLQFGSSVGYVYYEKNTANNGLEISPDSALTYAITLDDVILTLFDQISYTREVTTQAALANLATLPQLGNNAGLRVEWDPGRWTLQAGYSHATSESDSAHAYLNNTSENFFARAGWRFAEATQAGLEASSGLTDYQISGQGNNQYLSVGGYVDWQLRPWLHLSLRGGPSFYQFDSQGPGNTSSTLNSYYVNFEADQALTDYLTHSVNIQRSVSAGINEGSSYVEQLTGTYSISWALTQRISLGASATYEKGQQPGGFFLLPTNENFERDGAGLQANWQFTDHFSASVNFNYWRRNSNLLGRNYTEKTVQVQVSYGF